MANNPNRFFSHSRTEKILTGTLVGTGIGIAAELFLHVSSPYMSPLESFLFLPTRLAILGTAFGLGRADLETKGRTENKIMPFLIAGAIGMSVDVGETLLDKVLNPNFPLSDMSLLLAANTGALVGISAGYNYLWGRRSRPLGLDR